MTGGAVPTSRWLGLDCAPGETLFERVPVAEFADGSPVTIPVALIRGAKPGPSAYIQAAIHGDELTGTDAAWRLIASLKPAEMTGDVVVVPVANSPAFLTRSRGFMLEERILQDGNRVFPGNPQGFLTERIVASLFHGFVMQADLTVDLHCALAGSVIADFMHVGPRNDDDGHLELRERTCHAYGMPYHFYRKVGMKLGSSDMSRSISSQGAEAGKAVIMAEFGKSNGIDAERAEYARGGLLRILRELGVWRGETPEATPYEPREFSNIHMVHSQRGGGLRPRVAIGDIVKVGDPLASVLDIFGREVEEVRATEDGFVLRLMSLGSIASGAEVAWIGN